MSTPTPESANRWWLALDGRPEGPRTIAFLTAALQSGQLSLMTPVCPEGGCEWRPLGTWPTLAALVTTSVAAPSLPPPYGSKLPAQQTFSGTSERLLTNPALPPMGNVICIYSIVIVPLYWILMFAMVFNEDNPFIEGTGFYLAYGLYLLAAQLVTLGLTISLAIGGVQLHDLRSSGERLIRLTLSLGLVWVATLWIVLPTMLILGSFSGVLDESESSYSALDMFGSALQMAAFVFDVVCLVWLLRNRSRLPLCAN